MAIEVLDYEIKLLKKDKLPDKLVIATIIMSNKIVDKKLLKKFYEEVKNMLDILEIAREDGMKTGIQNGMEIGMQQGIQEGMQQGIQEGMEQGMQQGMEQGMEEGKIETLEYLYRQGILTLKQYNEMTEPLRKKLTIQ